MPRADGAGLQHVLPSRFLDHSLRREVLEAVLSDTDIWLVSRVGDSQRVTPFIVAFDENTGDTFTVPFLFGSLVHVDVDVDMHVSRFRQVGSLKRALVRN